MQVNSLYVIGQRNTSRSIVGKFNVPHEVLHYIYNKTIVSLYGVWTPDSGVSENLLLSCIA